MARSIMDMAQELEDAALNGGDRDLLENSRDDLIEIARRRGVRLNTDNFDDYIRNRSR